MNLVLDFGNTRIKAGLFQGGELLRYLVFDSVEDLLGSAISEAGVSRCIIASVTQQHPEILEQFSKKFSTLLFSAKTAVPLKNLYKSSHTLGSDRMAAAVGAFTFFPNENVLTIDAGTCIKYNFVNSNNEYLGGAISPGIPMRLKAMHEYTSALPLVDPDKAYHCLIGGSTSESLLSGALVGAGCEADEMINRYKNQFNDLQVVVTGGDGDYLCKQLKSPFFANQNILLYGLNSILNFNSEK